MGGEKCWAWSVPGADYVFSLSTTSISHNYIYCMLLYGESRSTAYTFVTRPVSTPQISLGVDDESFSTGERLLEEGVQGCEGDSVVATFYYQVDLREHGLHL